MIRRGGFTLVEVLLAMGLFIVGITAVLGLFQAGGGMDQAARAHARLAPHVEALLEELQDEAWILDPSGGIGGLRERKGETVPGAPEYRYDLVVEPAGEDSGLRLAALRFYRRSPERPVATVRFLLVRRVPLERRLAGE